jgi:hypothetical protein
MPRVVVLICAFLLSTPPAMAEPETHYVGVSEGLEETDGRIHGPEVRLSIDRPGAEIVLILADYGPVRWFVDVSPTTTLREIMLVGYRPERSEVLVNDRPFAAIRTDEAFPDPFRTIGRPFREFIDTMALRDDLPPLVSFNGDYRPPEAGFFIDATSAPVPEMSPDYLAQHVRPNHLTPALRAAMDQTPGDLLEFTGDGFALPNPEKPEDRQLFPVTLDVPEISWPVAAATDTRRGLFYGVSKGGEGLFYAFDPSSGAWSVMRGMDNFDASGMFYDAAQDRLILVGDRFEGMVDVLVLDPASGGETVATTRIPLEALVGYTDLYDVGNYRPPPLAPFAVDGDLVLLRTKGDILDGTLIGRRSYVVDLTSGQASLVDYVN